MCRKIICLILIIVHGKLGVFCTKNMTVLRGATLSLKTIFPRSAQYSLNKKDPEILQQFFSDFKKNLQNNENAISQHVIPNKDCTRHIQLLPGKATIVRKRFHEPHCQYYINAVTPLLVQCPHLYFPPSSQDSGKTCLVMQTLDKKKTLRRLCKYRYEIIDMETSSLLFTFEKNIPKLASYLCVVRAKWNRGNEYELAEVNLNAIDSLLKIVSIIHKVQSSSNKTSHNVDVILDWQNKSKAFLNSKNKKDAIPNPDSSYNITHLHGQSGEQDPSIDVNKIKFNEENGKKVDFTKIPNSMKNVKQNTSRPLDNASDKYGEFIKMTISHNLELFKNLGVPVNANWITAVPLVLYHQPIAIKNGNQSGHENFATLNNTTENNFNFRNFVYNKKQTELSQIRLNANNTYDLVPYITILSHLLVPKHSNMNN